MTGVSLDTSGFVDNGTLVPTVWRDLSPFEQGYVEAMFASEWPNILRQFIDKGMSEPEGHDDCVRPEFTDLARETLAAIRKDCADARRRYLRNDTPDDGRLFWIHRQDRDCIPEGYAPLTVTLGDDGKVRIAPVAGTTERSSRSGRTS